MSEQIVRVNNDLEVTKYAAVLKKSDADQQVQYTGSRQLWLEKEPRCEKSIISHCSSLLKVLISKQKTLKTLENTIK